MFTLIHTADWHLGHRYADQDRTEEHRIALKWLHQVILHENADLLIVAGDVFDTANPSNQSRQLYYDFMLSLADTSCRHVLVIAGNHDSPGMLDAPKSLLQRMGIHVFGKADQQPILPLRNEHGRLEAVVAAVPFLRSHDIRYSVAGESGMERVERIQTGIRQHYRHIGEQLEEYRNSQVPIIGTGHLHATGAIASEGQTDIYLSNHENINAQDFPDAFAYVALGHLHRAQSLGDHHHIRYSGSLLPMNFEDAQVPRSVAKVTFNGNALARGVELIEAPVMRPMYRIVGTPEVVKEKLQQWAMETEKQNLRIWVEVVVQTDRLMPNLYYDLQELVKDKPISVLKVHEERTLAQPLASLQKEQRLESLQTMDVFLKKCEAAGITAEQTQELQLTFLELQEWLRDSEE